MDPHPPQRNRTYQKVPRNSPVPGRKPPMPSPQPSTLLLLKTVCLMYLWLTLVALSSWMTRQRLLLKHRMRTMLRALTKTAFQKIARLVMRTRSQPHLHPLQTRLLTLLLNLVTRILQLCRVLIRKLHSSPSTVRFGFQDHYRLSCRFGERYCAFSLSSLSPSSSLFSYELEVHSRVIRTILEFVPRYVMFLRVPTSVRWEH